MRYFAVMNSGYIKTVTDIAKGDYENIHFNIGVLEFIYSIKKSYAHSPFCIGEHTNHTFYCWAHNEWKATRDIKYLLELNELEDKDLNYFQSTDFNAGVMYNKIEKTAASMLKEHSYAVSTLGEFTIPTIQLLIKNCSSIKEAETIKATIQAVINHFDAVYGNILTLDIYSWKRDKQYFKFCYAVRRKETYKEMTVAEIEEALGYKIKIIEAK